MDQEPVSTDPNFGLVSTDPNFGLPKGSERTRQDTNIIGIDHEKLKTLLDKWTSGLDPTFQKPAAMMAGQWLASLAEAFSAPENVATMGAKPALGAMGKVADAAKAVTGKVIDARAPIGSAVETAGRFIQAPKKVIGEAVERAGTAIKGQPAAATSSAAPESVVAGGTPSPPGPPAPAASASAMSPQRVMNDLAIQARRQGVKLSEQDYEVAKQAVAQGVSPTDAVAALKQTAGETPTGSMSQAYTQLRSAGKTHDQAMTAIRTQEALAKTLKTPSTEEVLKRVAYHNEHGSWPKDE